MEYRIGVKALVTNESGQVLLIEEDGGRHDDFVTLPGGGLKPDEAPKQGLRRELNEELAASADISNFVGTFTYEHRSWDCETTYLVFECSLTSPPIPQPSEGVKDTIWAKRVEPPETCLDCVAEFINQTPSTCEPVVAEVG